MIWNGKEEDLYAPVKNLFEKEGYTVRAEVGYCDIMAQKEDTVIAVELKKSLNLDVIIQATLNQRISDLSFIAVPKPRREDFTKRFQNICHVIRRLELGLILVSQVKKELYADIYIEPLYYERDMAKKAAGKRKEKLMSEFRERSGDYNVGGSTRCKKITVYREIAIHIAVLLEKNGQMSTKELRKAGTDVKKTTAILQDNYYGWFERISKGVFKLTEEGIKSLEQFETVANRYRQ